MTRGSALPAGQRTVQTKTVPPKTIGLAFPSPISGDFHAIFSAFSPPHLRGRFFSDVKPWPVGPRNCGQSSARALAKASSMNAPADIVLMDSLPMVVRSPLGFVAYSEHGRIDFEPEPFPGYGQGARQGRVHVRDHVDGAPEGAVIVGIVLSQLQQDLLWRILRVQQYIDEQFVPGLDRKVPGGGNPIPL